MAYVKDRFLTYGFKNYGKFVTRWSLYKLIVFDEL